MTVVPEFGGCVWPVDTACFTEEWDTFSPEVKARALALASATLVRLTGRRVGNCPITVRPCGATQCDRPTFYADFGYGRSVLTPMNWAGRWSNCGCVGQCSILHQVELPAPIGRVDEVRVGGSVLNSTDYRVDNGRFLVNLTDTPWPMSQDLTLPDTEPGTFSVTYLNAHPVDSLGAYAAGVLAMEYGRACAGNTCRLPSGVTTIVRQGITMEVEAGAFPSGLTGIREVDTFIALWNPKGMERQATVWSPDLTQVRHTTRGAGQ